MMGVEEIAGLESSEPSQERVARLLSGAQASNFANSNWEAALPLLEQALAEARSNPYEIEMDTRIRLALTTGEAYASAGELQKARRVVDEERAFVEQIFQLIIQTGTREQRRTATSGRVRIRDGARRLAILGEPAPELSTIHWVQGSPVTLSALRGRVVVLEFWATWCKPCKEMFPKLNDIDTRFRGAGLEILAITRHYFAHRNTAGSRQEETDLIASFVRDQHTGFRVGIADDEHAQELYGATNLPSIALIDREGVVRYANFGGGDDVVFSRILDGCLTS
jgi:thiol-disulfide isomerase/thioredoxin